MAPRYAIVDSHQGQECACVGFAITHALNTMCPSLNLTGTFAVKHVYWEAQRADPWEGGAYPEAKPRYEGTSVLHAVDQLQRHEVAARA